jgi:hypothetical protein
MDSGVYMCHICKSVQEAIIDSSLDSIGIYCERKHTFNNKAQALQLVRPVLYKVKGFNHMMLNGRDLRGLSIRLTDAFVTDLRSPSNQRLAPYTTQQLMHASSLLGWVVYHDGGGDLKDGTISLAIAVLTIIHVLGMKTDPNILSRKTDHFHVLLCHFVKELIGTLTYPIVMDEGAFEAHLRMLEKKLMKITSRQFAKSQEVLNTIAHLYAIVQGARLDVSLSSSSVYNELSYFC